MSECSRVLVSMATAKPEDEYSIIGLRRTYTNRLAKHRLSPLLVHPSMDYETIIDFYSLSSGVIFTGGQDIGVDKARDDMERMIARRAIKDNKPLVGICKGGQLIGQESEASLLEDLTTEPVNHGNGQRGYRAGVQEFAHDIYITDTSKDGVLFVKGQVLRNEPSNHHMAIDPSNTGKVRVLGVAADGVPEIGTRDDQDFCYVLQSHPEASDAMDPLFAMFAQAVLAFDRPNSIPWER